MGLNREVLGPDARKLVLETRDLRDVRGLCTIHSLIGFSDRISYADALYIAQLIQRVSHPPQVILHAFYTLGAPQWKELDVLPWHTLATRTFRRKLFFRVTQRPWVIGFSEDIKHLAKIFQFSWNMSGNETWLAVLGNSPSEYQLLAEKFVDHMESTDIIPRKLLEHFWLVVSRASDGIALELFTAIPLPSMPERIEGRSSDLPECQ